MLGNQNRHADPLGQRGEEGAERVDSAGRGADRQQLERLVALLAKQVCGRQRPCRRAARLRSA